MKAIELLKIGRHLLELLSKSDIRMNDYQYIALYEDYIRMRREGDKYEYVIARLAKQYRISESSVSRLIRRLGKDCHNMTSGKV